MRFASIRTMLAWVGVVAGLAAAPSVAEAAKLQAVYRGSVDGGAFDGASFFARFYYDTSDPGTFTSTSQGTSYNSTLSTGVELFLLGTGDTGSGSVLIFNEDFATANFDNGSISSISHSETDTQTGSGDFVSLAAYFSTGVVPLDLNTPFGPVTPLRSAGSFQGYDSVSMATVSGSFTVSSVEVIASSTGMPTVPLPASAPLFGAALIGLGAVGYAAKRRTVATTA